MNCMMRGGHGHHQPRDFGSHCDCQCHGHDYRYGHHHSPMRFPTKEEVVNHLEEYLNHIKKEAEAVEKQIQEMKESKE